MVEVGAVTEGGVNSFGGALLVPPLLEHRIGTLAHSIVRISEGLMLVVGLNYNTLGFAGGGCVVDVAPRPCKRVPTAPADVGVAGAALNSPPLVLGALVAVGVVEVPPVGG